jgi:integrase
MRKFPSVKELAKLIRPGRYSVGHGAYLQISQWGTRAWVFRYRRARQAHAMGLGSCEYVTLAEARAKAFELRRGLINGLDPLAAKRTSKRDRILAGARAKTFKECALEYIAAHEDGWRGDESRQQWTLSLGKHAFSKIGNLAVADIDVTAVLSVLDPIARTIPETARRVRNRIALILDWAAARELRPLDNPARRPKLLPTHKKAQKHFAAMAHQDVSAFLVELRQRREIGARALELQILTGVRPGEALGCRWSEIDADTWVIPGTRTKSGDAHRVPLSDRAVKLLNNLPRKGEFVFVGTRTGAHLYPTSMRILLGRMGVSVTAHGFRAAFRTWCEEQTAFPHAVVEAALGHKIPSAVERAYQRSDLLGKRARLMQDWANYCNEPAPAGEVILLRGV